MKKLLTLCLLIIVIPSLSFGAIYVWDGGAPNDRFSSIGNWDPTAPAGGPQAGDTGTVGSSFRVEIGTASELTTGAAIVFNDSSLLERNSTSFASMAGSFAFNDSSNMNISDLRLTSGAVLDWNSTGTFSNAPSGLGPTTMFVDVSDSTANMSAGLWSLNSGGADAIDVNGTFNMTGGVMEVATRFRVDGTFNLSGNSELWVADEFMNGVLNFVGTGATFYHLGADYTFPGRLDGNVQIDGVAQSDLSGFNVENVLVEGTEYTKIAVVPEPATTAFLLGVLTFGLVALRRRIRK